MTRPASGAAAGRRGSSGSSLDLIHTSNSPNPIPARVSGRFVSLERAEVEQAIAHCFAAFDGLAASIQNATEDEQAGVSWWNALTEQERGFWLAAAMSATPADAWECFKRSREADAPTT